MRHLLIIISIFNYYTSLISLYFVLMDQWPRRRHACFQKQRLNRRRFLIGTVRLLRNRASSCIWIGLRKDIRRIAFSVATPGIFRMAVREADIRKTAATRVGGRFAGRSQEAEFRNHVSRALQKTFTRNQPRQVLRFRINRPLSRKGRTIIGMHGRSKRAECKAELRAAGNALRAPCWID